VKHTEDCDKNGATAAGGPAGIWRKRSVQATGNVTLLGAGTTLLGMGVTAYMGSGAHALEMTLLGLMALGLYELLP